MFCSKLLMASIHFFRLQDGLADGRKTLGGVWGGSAAESRFVLRDLGTVALVHQQGRGARPTDFSFIRAARLVWFAAAGHNFIVAVGGAC